MSDRQRAKIPDSVPLWLNGFPIDLVDRIDLGLEGDWSGTVTTIWRRDRGMLGLDRAVTEHPSFRPALELYLADGWIGVHCFRQQDNRYVLDVEKVEALIQHVDTQ